MKKLIKHFGQSDYCQELYELEVRIKVSKSDRTAALQHLKKDMADFHYDRIKNGYIHAKMWGQYLTLANTIKKFEKSGWKLTL